MKLLSEAEEAPGLMFGSKVFSLECDFTATVQKTVCMMFSF